MPLERWYTAKQIAEAKNVSYATARRWIMKLIGDSEVSQKRQGRTRPKHLRRLPASKLAELDRLIN
jgi:transposase